MGPFLGVYLGSEKKGGGIEDPKSNALQESGEGQSTPTSPHPACWERFGADSASSPRFDLMGLTPDAPEDEAGIKKAAENSKRLWGGGSAELLGASPPLGQEQMPFFLSALL